MDYLNNGKIIIFLINISKNNNKIYSNDIEYVTETVQIFINNLFNKNNNFIKILFSSNEYIISNQLIDINIIIKNNIDSILRFFCYNIININNNSSINNNYKKTIIENIVKNKCINKILLECIINFSKNEEDFAHNIFYDKIINNKDNDSIQNNFLNIFYQNLKEKIFIYLRKIIYLLEKESIISMILFNQNIFNEVIIKKYIDEYILKICERELIKFNWENPYLNEKINLCIMLDTQLPLLTNIFEKLMNYINSNILSKYIENENSFIYKNIKIDIINKEKNKYLNKLKELNDTLKIEANKYDILKEILNSKNNLLISSIFKDIFLIFIKRANTFNDNYLEYLNILHIFFQLKFIFDDIYVQEKYELKESFLEIIINKDKKINEEKIDYFDIFVDILNFLQCHSKDLYYILEIYSILKIFDNSVLIKIKEVISNIISKIDDIKNNNRNNKNMPFFYLIEALSKIFNENINIYLNVNKKKYEKHLKLCQNFIQNILKFEKRFLLNMREISTMKINSKLINYCVINNNLESEQLSLICNTFKLISENNDYLEIKNYEKIHENLKSINNLLIKIFEENSNKYSEVMNEILLNQYKIEQNIYNQERIIKILLPDENNVNEKLIEKSCLLIQEIFNFESYRPLINENKENIKIENSKLKKKFLSIFEKKSPAKEVINNKKNLKLNKIILNHFEIICENFFEKLKNNNNNNFRNIVGGLSKMYLEESINYLDEETSGKYHKGLNEIGKIYCIAFIKRYLIYYINFLMSDDYQYLNERNEINRYLFEKNIKIRKTIKFYLLKICLEKYNYDYNNFTNFYYNDQIFGFKEYFNEIKLIKNEIQTDMPFLQLDLSKDNYNKYKILLSQNKEKNLDLEEINNFFFNNNNDQYDYFYTFFSNISFFSSYEEKIGNKYNNFKIMLNSIFGYISEKNIFDIEINFFIQTIVENIIDKYNLKQLEIILYSFRFIFNLLINKKKKNYNKNGFYLNILSNNIEQTIKDNYIPGNFPSEIILIHYFPNISEDLNSNPNNDIYLCSCGYYYKNNEDANCPFCGELLINQKENIENKNKKQYKISFVERRKKSIISIFGKKNNSFIEMSLKELENKIEKEKEKLNKNIKVPLKNIFLFRNDKIREIDELSYRFLNFLLYSFLFYSSLLGNIKEDKLNNYLIKDMNFLEIIETNLEIIEGIIKEKNIQNIQIFLNLIFEPINNILINNINKNFYYKEDAINFEKEINNIINEKINDNESFVDKYIKLNNNLLEIEPFSEKSIILEVEPFEIYSNDEYPEIKYFYKSKLPNKENFIDRFNSNILNKTKYPIINMIINSRITNKNLKLLKYLPIINDLCNYIIKNYSYKYSREEAKQKNIFSEIKEEKYKLLINKFYKIYKKLRPYAKKYDCYNIANGFNNLENEPFLSNFCIDTHEINYGMVIASIYMTLIEIQNSFINTIINSGNKNIKNYSKFIIKIMIQDCNKDEIVKLPSFDDNNEDNEDDIELLNDDIDNNAYNNEKIDLMKIIISNSYYYNNNYLKYNFDSIEDSLASFILPKIKSFYSSENCLRTIIYQYEGFRNKSNIITEYSQKYEQRELYIEEINIIIAYILKEQKNINFNIKNFLFSLQILIDIILSNNYEKNEKLYIIIINIEDNPNISIIKQFFKNIKIVENKNNKKSLFTINCLIDFMNFIEKMCWEKIKDNTHKEYLIELNDNTKDHIDKIFLNKNNLIINKEILSTAVRRFISRYLIGKREENEINSNNNLYYYLEKVEFWPINFTKNVKFKEELNKILIINENNYISVGQSTKLYEYLGGDLLTLEQIIKKMKEEKNKENKDIINNNEGINSVNNIINEDNQNNFKNNSHNQNNKINNNIDLINEIKDEEGIEEEEEQSQDYDNDDEQEFSY